MTRMKLIKLLAVLILLLIIGGFTYLALTDVPVEQQQMQKTLPSDLLLKDL